MTAAELEAMLAGNAGRDGAAVDAESVAGPWGPLMDETRHLLPIPDGAPAPRPDHAWWCTQCPVCGPVNDWTNTAADARQAARSHKWAHDRRAYQPPPI